jgi:hypothetical protein
MPTTLTNPLPACDCLNDCGDDPRLDRGTAKPCQVYVNHIKRAEARGAEAEREACAAIANEHKEHCYDGDQDWYKCRSIEAAIRARGNK